MTPSVQPDIHTTEVSQPPDFHHILDISRRGYQWELQFVQLPPEVLLLIIDHMNMAERISLLATCSYLRRFSEPLLYRHLDPDDNWMSRRRIQLLRTLGERQDLLLHIRSFRGRLIPTSLARPCQPSKQFWDSIPTTLLQDEWSAISAPLLLQAINIRDLDFTDNIDWQANGRWELFKNAVSDMTLHGLALGSTSREPLDFIPILRGQPELTRLELTCPAAHFNGLQEADVPKLKAFKGTWRQAAVIVPGRPVGCLDLNCVSRDDCQCLEEQIFQKLLQSSATVYKFKAWPHRAFDDTTLIRMLQLIRQYLPKIVDFAIVAGGGISAHALLDEIPKFSMISSLMILDARLNTGFLAGASSADFSHLEINTWKKLLERLKELCPSLTDVGYTKQLWFGCGFAYGQYLESRQAYL